MDMKTKEKPARGLYLWELALLAGLAAVLLWGALSLREQTALSEKVVRLHVLANSDSEEDQALKLRVRIRAAEGQDWWCLVFPPLCAAAWEGVAQTALAAGRTEGQVGLITEADQGYELRLKSVELWEKLKERFE